MTKQNKKMPLESLVRLRYLLQNKGVEIYEQVKRLPNYSKSDSHIHTKHLDKTAKINGRKLIKGRPERRV